MFAYAGAASKFGITCEKATPSDAKQATPSDDEDASSSQSFGQPSPKKSFPASTTIAIWITRVRHRVAEDARRGRRPRAAACRACA